jgi:hypothetical protein
MLLNSSTVPHCLLTTLKVVKFAKFVGHDNGLSIAKFIKFAKFTDISTINQLNMT